MTKLADIEMMKNKIIMIYIKITFWRKMYNCGYKVIIVPFYTAFKNINAGYKVLFFLRH